MSEKKWTPGPWTLDTSEKWPQVYANETVISSSTERIEDAHLIAAAPDLYEALEELLEHGIIGGHSGRSDDDEPCDDEDCATCKVQAVLAAARGEGE